MDFYLIPLHLAFWDSSGGIDGEIPWVKTATLLAGAIFGEVEAGRGLEMGFSGVLMLTPTLFCQSGTVLT